MTKNCSCPTYFNIFIGLFLIAFSIIGFLGLFQVSLPLWLSLVILILGLLTVILNSINKVYNNAHDLNVDQVNKLHAREGY